MKIWGYLTPDRIFLNAPLVDKDAVLRFSASAFARSGVVKNAEKLYDGMKYREKVMSTGIGDGIGIPHTTSAEAKGAALLLIRLANPIDFESLDARPVDIVMALVVSENETSLHLQLLAGVSRLYRDHRFLKIVRGAGTSEDLLDKIRSLEEEMAFH